MTWIEVEIVARGGEVSFRDFMELALYHPEHGYYSAAQPRHGPAGDYLTAPTASAWYGRVAARMARRLAGRTGPFTLVDVASGSGAFIAEIVERLGQEASQVLARVVSVERSQAMRGHQTDRWQDVPVGVEQVADVGSLPPVEGPIFLHACELHDALPVHRVVGRRPRPEELWVGTGAGGLEWRSRPARDAIVAYLESHGVELEDGQLAEVSLEARPLHARLLGLAAGPGVAVTLDYGYEAVRLYDPRGRRAGSLATYHRHRLGRNPLDRPGELDITTHVNWDDLRGAATGAGWREVGLWPLAELLVRGGLAVELHEAGLGEEADLDADTVTARQEVKRLLDPEGMGSDLKALVQCTADLEEAVREVLALESDGGGREAE